MCLGASDMQAGGWMQLFSWWMGRERRLTTASYAPPAQPMWCRLLAYFGLVRCGRGPDAAITVQYVLVAQWLRDLIWLTVEHA